MLLTRSNVTELVVGEMIMRRKIYSLFFVFSLLLTNCGNEPDIVISEKDTSQFTYEEIIHMNNCGGKANIEQVASRSFTTNIEGGGEVRAGYAEIISGGLTAKYGQVRDATKSIKLVAPPGTNMNFVLRWSEENRAGNVKVNGEEGTYNVRIPIGVEQLSSNDLGCQSVNQNSNDPHNNNPLTNIDNTVTPTSAPKIPNVGVSLPTSQEYKNIPNIWDLIPYRNPNKPSTLIYNVSIQSNKRFRWGAVWCGLGENNLREISKPLSMTLLVDGQVLTNDVILELEETNGEWKCHRWVTILSNWQTGTNVRLELRYSLSKPIYDGVDYYQDGEYHLIIDAQAQ